MFGPKIPQAEEPFSEDGTEADLEDMVGTKLTGRKKPRPVIRVYDKDNQISSAQTTNKSVIEDGVEEPPARQVREATPDKNVDYEAWLEHKKRKWKETRDKRKRSGFVTSLTLYILYCSELLTRMFIFISNLVRSCIL